MSIRSGKGDKGFTNIYFHKRISKNSVDIAAIGDLDELNAYLGLAKARIKSKKDKAILEKVQQTIALIMSEIVIGGEKRKKMGLLINKDKTDWIKQLIGRFERETKVESCFYIPGDNELSAFLDVTRAVARRAERSMVGLFREERIENQNILTYLNCVSDLLFIMARRAGKRKRKRR